MSLINHTSENMEIKNSGIDLSRDYVPRETKIEKAYNTTAHKSNKVVQELERGNEQNTEEQEKRFIKHIEDANGMVQDENNEFQFSVHEQTKQILIKVVDKQTQEVVKELPPEKILDMVAKMCEVAGIFVDEKR